MDGEKSKLLISRNENQSWRESCRERVWPYLVFVSCFLSYFASGGLDYGIAGSLTTIQQTTFNITLEESSWASSIHFTTAFVTVPFASLLTRLISIWKIQFVGALLSLLGLALCFMATQPWHVALLFGFTAGVGSGLAKAACVAALVYHFEKERLDLTTGTMQLGFSLGLALLPILTSIAFENCGFSNAMLAISSILLVHFCGVLTFSNHKHDTVKRDPSENKTVLRSLKVISSNGKVWAFVLCTFFRKFGLTAFFSTIDNYITVAMSVSLSEAAEGPTVAGAFTTLGMVLVLFFHNRSYSRLIPHCLTTSAIGVLMVCVTLATNRMSFLTIMALLGVVYGAQLANLIAVAHELVGSGEMVLVFGFEFFMQGVGGLVGGPIVGLLAERVGDRYGLYVCGISSIIGGLFIAGIIIHGKLVHHHPL